MGREIVCIPIPPTRNVELIWCIVEAHDQRALDDDSLQMLLSFLGAGMSEEEKSLLRKAALLRREALQLDTGVENSIPIATFTNLLSSMAAKASPLTSYQVQRTLDDHILSDDGKSLPIRIVSLLPSSGDLLLWSSLTPSKGVPIRPPLLLQRAPPPCRQVPPKGYLPVCRRRGELVRGPQRQGFIRRSLCTRQRRV